MKVPNSETIRLSAMAHLRALSSNEEADLLSRCSLEVGEKGQQYIGSTELERQIEAQIDLMIAVATGGPRIQTKNKVLAQRANKAFEQVTSWKGYIRNHRREVLETVERYGKEKDLHRGPRDQLTCTAGKSIFDLVVHVSFSYGILMGRRKDLPDDMLGRKAAFKEDRDVEFMTCDRLFYVADKIDTNPKIYI